jgi:hypothetical protein
VICEEELRNRFSSPDAGAITLSDDVAPENNEVGTTAAEQGSNKRCLKAATFLSVGSCDKTSSNNGAETNAAQRDLNNIIDRYAQEQKRRELWKRTVTLYSHYYPEGGWGWIGEHFQLIEALFFLFKD